MTGFASPILTLCVLIAATGFPNARLVAQRSTVPPRLEVIRSEGTPDDLINQQSITTKLRDRLDRDASVATQLDEAVTKRDFLTVKKLIASSAQVPVSQVSVFDGRSFVRAPSRQDVVFRLASYDAAASPAPMTTVTITIKVTTASGTTVTVKVCVTNSGGCK